MSEIYLTKVERKTIFTQGLVYVLITMVVSDLNVVGPYEFLLIPWLFFLGILGVSKFYHPIMTTMITTVTTFMTGLFKYNGLENESIYLTVVAFLTTVFGIIVGMCIKDFVLEHRLVKYITTKKKTINIVAIVLLTILSFGISMYRYGDIVTYILSRNTLDNKLTEDYTGKYKILTTKHAKGKYGEYLYKVDLGDQTVEIYTKKDEIVEIGFETRCDTLNLELNNELVNYTDTNAKVSGNYEFSKISLFPSGIILNIHFEEDTAKEEILEVVKLYTKFVDKNNIEVSKIILTVGNNTQIISSNVFFKLDIKYITLGMEVEELDSYKGLN